MWLLTGGRFDI